MKCDCGKPISTRMNGKCMACRYKAARAMRRPRILVDIAKLPKPKLPPTKPVKIGEVVPMHYVNSLSETLRYPTSEERKERGMDKNRKPRSDAYTPELDDRIWELYNEGKKYWEIGKAVGRTEKAIGTRISKLKKERGSDGRKKTSLQKCV